MPIIGGAKCIVAHPTKIFGRAMAHPAHAAAPPWQQGSVYGKFEWRH